MTDWTFAFALNGWPLTSSLPPVGPLKVVAAGSMAAPSEPQPTETANSSSAS